MKEFRVFDWLGIAIGILGAVAAAWTGNWSAMIWATGYALLALSNASMGVTIRRLYRSLGV